MGRIKEWFQAAKWVLLVACLILGLAWIYGEAKFRAGVRLGQAQEQADAEKRRIEEDRREVRDAAAARDGATLYRRAKEWIEAD